MICQIAEKFLKAIKQQPWEKELDEISTIYGDDIDRYRIEAQLPLLHTTAKAMEYNTDKFKLIEENASVDDLNSTFNFLNAYNSKNNTSTKDFLLKAPIFKSIRYFHQIQRSKV